MTYRFNLELDLWELQILVDHLSLESTSFKDEDGNSDWLSILII